MNGSMRHLLLGGLGALAVWCATRGGVARADGGVVTGSAAGSVYGQTADVTQPGHGRRRILGAWRSRFRRSDKVQAEDQATEQHAAHIAAHGAAATSVNAKVWAEVKVVHGRSRLLQSSRNIIRHEVANPEIAQIAQFTDKEIKEVALMGLAEGTTTVTLWIYGETQPVALAVRVIKDPNQAPVLEAASGAVPSAAAVTQTAQPAVEQQPAAEPALPAEADTNYARQMPALAVETSPPIVCTKETPEVNRAGLAPPTVCVVGKPVKRHIVVKNVGPVDAEEVEVRAAMSLDASLIATEPKAQVVDGSTMVWRIGRIAAGCQQTLSVKVRPMETGELSCKTSLSFRSGTSDAPPVQVMKPAMGEVNLPAMGEAGLPTMGEAGLPTMGEPKLHLICTGPTDVVIGSEVRVTVTITNVGTGPAEAVQIHQMVPEVIQASGDVAAAPAPMSVGTLKPGEQRVVDAVAVAREPGVACITLLAESSDGTQAAGEHLVKVRGPQLALSTIGPEFRIANRKATYQLVLSNPGNLQATNVNVLVGLPPGLQYVESSDDGEFNEQRRTVDWKVGDLEPGATRELSVTVVAKSEGEHLQRAVAWANNDLLVTSDKITRVEGTTSVSMKILSPEHTIEVGGESAYQIRIVNRGTKVLECAQLTAIVPEGLEVVGAEGPGAYRIQGQHVIFDAVPSLSPQSAVTVNVRVKGVLEGDWPFRVELTCPTLTHAIVAEEVTQVYGE